MIADDIGRKIVTGRIEPLSLLPTEAELCETYRTSRTVIRESMKFLLSKGLVESKPKVGSRVRPREVWNLFDPDILFWLFDTAPSDHDLRSIYELRRLIEPYAAALAAVRRTPQDVRRIESAYRKLASAEDWEQPDIAFHQAVFAASSNYFMSSLASLLQTSIRINWRLSRQHSRKQADSLPLHRAVLDAIRDRKPLEARRKMLQLVKKSESEALMLVSIAGAGRSGGDGAGSPADEKSQLPSDLFAAGS